MCGIAGFFSAKSKIDFDRLNIQVDNYLATRGPDYSGVCYFNGGDTSFSNVDSRYANGSFWHKRLSIIDVSNNANQPMEHPSGNVIAFNGEIYNYLELREELIAHHYTFNTKSDTEVILAAFDRWGLKSFDRFIGMFAIALLNLKNGELILARDSIGIKPLYYSCNSEMLAFSSRADLTAQMVGQNSINLASAYNFIEFGISDNDENTMFYNVNSLLPGEVRVYNTKTLQLISTSKIDYSKAKLKESNFDNASDKKEALRTLLADSLRLHTRTDVGFCTTLSGGLDSSSIVGLLDKIGIHNIKPYSYIPENEDISEQKWINIVANQFGLDVNYIRYSPDDFWADLPDFVNATDMPVNSMSMYSQYKIYQAIAKAGHKVVLDGQGGDEMFGGYVQYLYYKGYEDLIGLKLGRFLKLMKGAKATVPTSFLYKNMARLMLYNSSSFLYEKLRSAGNDPIIDNNYFNSKQAIKLLNFNYETSSLKGKLLNDLKFQDLPRLLRYADRASMRWSLESRVPFATQPLLSFVETLSSDDFVSADGVTKDLFRKAVEPVLPTEIYNRKDKKGFNTDYEHVLYSEKMVSIIENIVSSTELLMINKSALISALKRKVNYPSNKLWRIVSLLLWIDAKKLN